MCELKKTMTGEDQESALESGTLRLWVADPDALLADRSVERAADGLSAEERARMQSLRFAANRREFVVAHLLVRQALSHAAGLAPEAWRFRVNDYGKPAVEPACGMRFNLSHRKGLAVCLVAQGVEVGVDVEAVERGAEILAITEQICSPQELVQLAQLREDEQRSRALTLWTLKEAYSKARGLGLSLALQKISFVWSDEEGVGLADASLAEAHERCRFCVIDYSGHRIALVTEPLAEPKLELWELGSLEEPPTRRRLSPVPEWFPFAAVSR